MVFGIDPVQLALKEFDKLIVKLKKIDVDHDGISDVEEAKALFLNAVQALKNLNIKITPAEIAKGLNVIFPGKFNEHTVEIALQAAKDIIEALQKVLKVGKQAQDELGK